MSLKKSPNGRVTANCRRGRWMNSSWRACTSSPRATTCSVDRARASSGYLAPCGPKRRAWPATKTRKTAICLVRFPMCCARRSTSAASSAVGNRRRLSQRSRKFKRELRKKHARSEFGWRLRDWSPLKNRQIVRWHRQDDDRDARLIDRPDFATRGGCPAAIGRLPRQEVACQLAVPLFPILASDLMHRVSRIVVTVVEVLVRFEIALQVINRVGNLLGGVFAGQE